MKKIFLVLPIIAMLAASCNSSQQAIVQAPAAQNTNPAPNPITLSVNPASLSLNIQQGTSATSSPVLSVALSSGTTDLISTSVNYESGNGWLSTGNSIGSTLGSVVVSLNPSSLSVGSYSATISVSESGLTTSVPVTLTVSAPAPISTSPNSKTFASTQYGFEFQYPYKNLSVTEGFVSSGDPQNLIYVVNIFNIPHGQDRDGLIGVFNLPLTGALQSLGFVGQNLPTESHNGITWTKVPRQDAPGDYLTEKTGKTFWLTYSGGIKQSDFESILNSFKFTK
jgi:hypothetical protein